MEFRNEYKIYTLNQISFFKEFLKEYTYIKIKDFSTYKLMFQNNI